MTKKFFRFDFRTLRLSITYLGIIMIMSVGFSLVLYVTSLSLIAAELRPNQPAIPDVKAYGDSDSYNYNLATANELATTKIQRARRELQQDLALLNLGTLAFGGLLSYYLARRTLRPIETALEAQARFASDASHELRTPLAIMQTEIDVVLRNPLLSLERAKAALLSNRQEISRLKELSEGLLRLTQHTQPLTNQTQVQVKELFVEATARVIKIAQAKRITIDSDAPSSSVSGDAPSLVRVLTILLENAIKYSPSGSRVYLTTRLDTHAVCLEVRDEGPGIAAEHIPHIFERFYRADSSRSHDVDGYGLGLTIAHAIITQHQGTITVHSTPGAGSVFTLRLPR